MNRALAYRLHQAGSGRVPQQAKRWGSVILRPESSIERGASVGRSEDDLIPAISARFSAVLVDEFQDTDDRQWLLRHFFGLGMVIPRFIIFSSLVTQNSRSTDSGGEHPGVCGCM